MKNIVDKVKVSQLINDNNNPAANQFVIKTPNGIYFQSYDSVVAFYDNDHKLYLGRDWDYSNTTRKHLYIFIRDYTKYCIRSRKELLDYITEGEIVENDKLN